MEKVMMSLLFDIDYTSYIYGAATIAWPTHILYVNTWMLYKQLQLQHLQKIYTSQYMELQLHHDLQATTETLIYRQGAATSTLIYVYWAATIAWPTHILYVYTCMFYTEVQLQHLHIIYTYEYMELQLQHDLQGYSMCTPECFIQSYNCNNNIHIWGSNYYTYIIYVYGAAATAWPTHILYVYTWMFYTELELQH